MTSFTPLTASVLLDPTAQRAQRARIKLAELRGGTPSTIMFTAVELANMADVDAIEAAEAFALDIDTQPTICLSRRMHLAHGTCKGLDARGVIDVVDRILDDLL